MTTPNNSDITCNRRSWIKRMGAWMGGAAVATSVGVASSKAAMPERNGHQPKFHDSARQPVARMGAESGEELA